MTNTIPTPHTVDKLVRNFNGNDKDLIVDLRCTVFSTGEEFDVTETEEVDILDDTTSTNTTEVIMYETSYHILCTYIAK